MLLHDQFFTTPIYVASATVSSCLPLGTSVWYSGEAARNATCRRAWGSAVLSAVSRVVPELALMVNPGGVTARQQPAAAAKCIQDLDGFGLLL